MTRWAEQTTLVWTDSSAHDCSCWHRHVVVKLVSHGIWTRQRGAQTLQLAGCMKFREQLARAILPCPALILPGGLRRHECPVSCVNKPTSNLEGISFTSCSSCVLMSLRRAGRALVATERIGQPRRCQRACVCGIAAMPDISSGRTWPWERALLFPLCTSTVHSGGNQCILQENGNQRACAHTEQAFWPTRTSR